MGKSQPFYSNRIFDYRMIQNMKRIAHQFDINAGGYCDTRMGTINFWCGPDDKPEGWEADITEGALDFPRAYVGCVNWENGKLEIETAPYELMEQYQNKLPENLYENCRKWLKVKILELIRLADLMPDVVGTKCPLCDFVLPPNHLFNELIKHMTIHGRVTGIVMGEPVVVKINDVRYALEDAKEF